MNQTAYVRLRGALIALVIFAVLVSCLHPLRCAQALEAPDASRSCSLSLECAVSGKAIPGMHFSLYRVAGFDESGAYALVPAFAKCGLDVSALSKASDWAQAAEGLESWARANALPPAAQGVTSAGGVASFSSLSPGLYLAGAASAECDGEPFFSAAFLIAVPGPSSNGEAWNYNVAAEPKMERGAISAKEEHAAKNAFAKTCDASAATGDIAICAVIAGAIVAIVASAKLGRIAKGC